MFLSYLRSCSSEKSFSWLNFQMMQTRNTRWSIVTAALNQKRSGRNFHAFAILKTAVFLGLFLHFCSVGVVAQESEQDVSFQRQNDRVLVLLGQGAEQKLFAEYRNQGLAKPVLYPVMAPGQVPITRHFPMDDTHADEAQDHPHHKSIWFAHGDVNGLDYWTEKATIENKSVELRDDGSLVSTNAWLSKKGEPICSDVTVIRFSAGDDWRLIDYEVTLEAIDDIVLGDTKEGTFAVRTHPALRLVGKDKKATEASAVNSVGTQGKAIWGQAAAWVHYAGQIDQSPYSITVMDHPQSLRHPTTWHAREYGLVAANPFGLSYFQKAAKNAGDLTLKRGEKCTFRYGVYLHLGKLEASQVEEVYQRYAR